MTAQLTVAAVRQLASDMDYVASHTTRMVGREFIDANGNEMRSVRYNQVALDTNKGARGPLAFEVTYGSGTVRVRGFYGTELVGLVDFTESRYDHAVVEMRDLDAQMRGRLAADKRAWLKVQKGKR